MFNEVKQATERMARERAATHEQAVGAIRALAAKLREALGDERLKGLPNLGTGSLPFPAVNIRARPDRELPRPSAPGHAGRSTLVLTDTGHIMSARMLSSGVIDLIAPTDQDFQAEDLRRVGDVIVGACNHHLRFVRRRSAQWGELRDLANRLQLAIAP